MAARPASRPKPGLIADAEAAYAFAVARYPAERLVLWGESLGSGVAVALAAEQPVGRVVLEAPFTSAVDVARRGLLVPAGQAADEGSVPLRRAHCQRAGAAS